MAARFINVDRNTPMLLPPDLREWVKDDELVHFIIEAVERLPLNIFEVNHRGSGSRQMPPTMMLALLIYSYCNGIFSSRKIERATYNDVRVRYLTGNHHPDHDTICAFRRKNFEAISEAFVDVLELAKELSILSLGNVALDGTHIKANASIDKNVTYPRAGEIREQLKLDIGELMARADQADLSDEDAEKLPAEITRREKLAAKMDQAIAKLKDRAAKRQEIEAAKHEEKLKKREDKEKETGKKTWGSQPKAHEIKPQESKEQCNLTDPDSRVMRKNKRSGFTQSYNCQAGVDTEGSQLIVGNHVSQSPSDSGQLEPGIKAIDERTGTPSSVSADAGYVNADMIERVEKNLNVEVYCSVHREDAHSERHYDFRPANQTERPTKTVKDPRLIQMGEKLKSEKGKEIYSRRNHTVETVFGIIKQAMGFRGFLLRGIEKVSGEWELVCLSYNLKRLHKLVRAA